MPLSLLSISTAVICNQKELETYKVKQEGTSSLSAYIASEAGKQFHITYSNNSRNVDVSVWLCIDGRLVSKVCLRPGEDEEFLGPYNSATSILPLKFQELQLVDSEDALIAPEMGTIELKVYRCRIQHNTGKQSSITHEDLYRGSVSERSKKAGWHHVSTGDEIPFEKCANEFLLDYVDSQTGPPYASIKVFYRPRELLRAQGIIPENDVGGQESPTKNKKRTREDESPGPSRSRPNIKTRTEDPSLAGDERAQRIRALQAELNVLKAEATGKSGTSVKRELRSPSPIVVRNAGEVVDLTLDD